MRSVCVAHPSSQGYDVTSTAAAKGKNCRAHSPQRIRFRLNYPKKQGRREGELRLERDMKMIRAFLIGILCGVMLAAGVTFALTIPATNDHWRTEIVNRGGGTWYVDKEGNLGWMWTVQPISYRGHPAPAIIHPHPRRASDSSLERL